MLSLEGSRPGLYLMWGSVTALRGYTTHLLRLSLCCLKPLPVCDAELEALAHRHRADVARVALLNRLGKADLNFNVDFPTSSSLNDIIPDLSALPRPFGSDEPL